MVDLEGLSGVVLAQRIVAEFGEMDNGVEAFEVGCVQRADVACQSRGAVSPSC